MNHDQEAHRLRRVFRALQPNQTLIYHVGNLAVDAPDRPDIQAVRDLMMDLRSRRLGRLSQRRLADGVFEYLCTKSPEPTATSDEE
jgi:hypothetical protein